MKAIELVNRGLVVLAAMLLASPTLADESDAQASTEVPEERIEVLEEQMGILAEELDALRKSVAVPEDGELVSIYGFGPAASKIYQKERGLSIGSYGELRFRAYVDDADEQTNIYDAVRAVIYLGYKFNDWLLVNSEFEFEHAGTGGGGSVSVEFLNIDFLLHENANARVGLLLVPMGFINELHEPTTYFGAERPEPELRIIPTTWRENGAGLFGDFAGGRVSYRAYAVNGLDASGFSNNGLRGGRQKGSEALSDHWGGVFRTDVNVLPGLDLGGSVYAGKSGQNQDGIPDTMTTIWELHGQYRRYGASLRALYTQAHTARACALSIPRRIWTTPWPSPSRTATPSRR